MAVAELIIHGETYRVTVADDEVDRLVQIGEYVDRTMRSIGESAQVLSTTKVGVMAAIQIAAESWLIKEELEKSKKAFEALESALDTLTE